MDTSNLEEEMKQMGDLDEEFTEDAFDMQKTKSAINLSKVFRIQKRRKKNWKHLLMYLS